MSARTRNWCARPLPRPGHECPLGFPRRLAHRPACFGTRGAGRPGHVLHAIASRDADRAAAYAAEFGARASYGSYTELLADPAVDLIYNALPNDAHAPWTIRALEAGKHVLCEKPLSLSSAEVRLLQDAERRTGRRVMEAFCHLFHPQMARVRQIIDDGEIGRLLAMHSNFGNTLERTGDFRWIARHGGGALYDLGCYSLSAMRVLAGREPLRVSAVQAISGEVDATLSAMLDFGGGIAGQFICSFDSARTQTLTLIGTKATVAFDWPFSTKGRDTTLMVANRVERFSAFDPYVAMVAHFGQAVSGEAEMARGLDWSLAQASAIDALLQSARSGATVSPGR